MLQLCQKILSTPQLSGDKYLSHYNRMLCYISLEKPAAVATLDTAGPKMTICLNEFIIYYVGARAGSKDLEEW
jgi:hypothetical protein